MIKLIQRCIIWLQIYNQNVLIDGQSKCLTVVKNPSRNLRITLARQDAKRERTRLRGEYTATFKPGQRFTWGQS